MKRQVSGSSSTTRIRGITPRPRRPAGRRARSCPRRPALELDRAAVRLDHLAQDRQAEARALAGRLGGVERIEHARQVLGQDPVARVRHDQSDTRVVASRRQLQPSARRHRVDALVTRFKSACSSCARSAPTRGRSGATSSTSSIPWPTSEGRTSSASPGDELAGRERAQAQRRPPRLVEQGLHDRGDAGDLLLDRSTSRAASGEPACLLRLQQLDVARDHVERRADLVRDRGRHLPRECQPLALRELAASVEQTLRGRAERLVRRTQLLGRALHLAAGASR